MNTQNNFKIIKSIILLILFSTILINCDQDEVIEINPNKNDIKLYKLTFDDFKNKNSLDKQIKQLSKSFDFNRTFNKNISSTDNSFTILTNEIYHVVNNTNESYTFLLETPTDTISDFENFNILIKQDSIIEYTITKFKLIGDSEESFPFNHEVMIQQVSQQQIDLNNFNNLLKTADDEQTCYEYRCALSHRDFEECIWMLFEVECPYSGGPTDGNTDSSEGGPGPGDEGPHGSENIGENSEYGTGGVGSSSSDTKPVVGIIRNPSVKEEIQRCLLMTAQQDGNSCNVSDLDIWEQKTILNFLKGDNCRDNDASNFAYDMIEAMCQENNDEDYILGIVKDDTFLDTDTDCIYENLKNNNNGDNFFNDMLSEFGDTFSNLTFSIGDTPVDVNGNPSIGFTKSESVIFGNYQANYYEIISSPEAANSSNLNIMVNLSHELMHAFMFKSLEEWDVVFFNSDGLPQLTEEPDELCDEVDVSQNINLNTLTKQDKWMFLICYFHENNTGNTDWSHSLYNSPVFNVETYREKLEQLLLNTHDWDSEPQGTKDYMIQIFGESNWKQKVAEYMSWTGLESTPEYGAWLETQSSYLSSSIPNLNDLFLLAVTDWWIKPSNISYVSNNCN